MKQGPYFLVAHRIRKHHGPFTTESDAVLAKNIAREAWREAEVMNKNTFESYLMFDRS